MSLPVWIGVALLGGVGAVARFLLDGLVSDFARTDFPAGTLAVNLSGAAILGALAGAAVHGTALAFAATGAIGAFTTFSTWMLETQRLAEDGRLRLAALNVALSLAAGLVAVALGHAIGSAL